MAGDQSGDGSRVGWGAVVAVVLNGPYDDPVIGLSAVLVCSGWDDGSSATNRLLLENGNGLQLEDGSGDLALE